MSTRKGYEQVSQSETSADVGKFKGTVLHRSCGGLGRRHAVFLVLSLLAVMAVSVVTLQPFKGQVVRSNKENTEISVKTTPEDQPGRNDIPPNDDESTAGMMEEVTSDYASTVEPVQDNFDYDNGTVPKEEDNHIDTDGEESARREPTIANRCAARWSPEFTQRYTSECQYWISSFEQWESTLTKSAQIVGYLCDNMRACKGWGDRTGGILSGFMKAILNKSKFRIAHPGLKDLFTPCLLKPEVNWISDAEQALRLHDETCVAKPSTHCNSWLEMTCPNSKPLVTVNTDRVCIPNTVCTELLETKKGKLLNPASVVGCPLRALLEPSMKMRDRIKVPMRVAGESSPVVHMTMKEIEELFSRYFIISIHFRLGDLYAFSQNDDSLDNKINLKEEQYIRPFHCADTLERYLVTNQKTNGKPVRWFLASDSYRLKVLAAKTFGERVMLIDEPPEHVAVDGSVNALSQTLAEWYLISLGNELIVNKMGGTAGNFYDGRVSAFAKTAWVYQLKHEVYDAGTCRRYSLPFEGIWSELKATTCQKESVFSKGLKLYKQEHLDALKTRGVTFPHAYISASSGAIIRVNSTFRTSAKLKP